MTTPSTFATLGTYRIAARMGARFHHTQELEKMRRIKPPPRDLIAEIHALTVEQLKHPERAVELTKKRAALRDMLREQRHAEHEHDMLEAQSMPEIWNREPWASKPAPHRLHCHPERRAGFMRSAFLAVLFVAIAVALVLEYFGVLTQ